MGTLVAVAPLAFAVLPATMGWRRGREGLRIIVARLVFVLMLGLELWMLYDAYKRRAETYWLYIIVLAPGGPLIYFFMVKIRDPGLRKLERKLWSALERPPSPALLERRFNESPSIQNRIRLAQSLGDHQRWAEAKPHFQLVLEQRPDDGDALFGLGVTELELGNPEAACEALERLVELAPSFRDYIAYPDLAEALARAGRLPETVSLLEELARRQPRLSHVVLYARYLLRAGEAELARDELRRALERYDDSPKHVRRDQRAAARQAKQLLSAPR